MDQQRHRPVLVEFWDMSVPQSMRTMPYLKEWHARYSDAGLRVIGAHTPSSDLTASDEVVGAAVTRLGIEYPVLNDAEGELWSFHGCEGYPSRYLWNGDFRLVDLHIGEGNYLETEILIQDMLGIERDPFGPVRPEDAPDALVAAPSNPVEGAHSGDYTGGGVWVSVTGHGVVHADGREFAVEGPSAIELRSHPASIDASIAIEAGDGVTVIATVFTPGLLAEAPPAA